MDVLEKKLISNFRDFGSKLFIPCQLYFGSDKSFFWNKFYLLSFSLGFRINKYGAVHKLCFKVRVIQPWWLGGRDSGNNFCRFSFLGYPKRNDFVPSCTQKTTRNDARLVSDLKNT